MGKIPEKEGFMKRKIGFLILLILAGALSYYGAYELYGMYHPKVEMPETFSLQRAPAAENLSIKNEDIRYYWGIIEQDQVLIYQMPEQTLYDSVKLSSLQLQNEEKGQLMKGKLFPTLTEVFEFLENSMS